MRSSKQRDVQPEPMEVPDKPGTSKLRTFLQKLRKRRIIESLAAFIGGGWLLLEFVHWILVDHYHFPEKTIDITFVTIVGALICTLIWQWFSRRGAPRKFKLEFVLIPLVLLVMIFVDINLILRLKGSDREPIPATKRKNSIAVLPFANELSQDGRLALGDSMAEEITGRLRSLERFPVKSNSAVTRFKGTDKSLKLIGEELGVDYLITGKIRAAEEEIEVYVELTETRSENQVWDEHYPDRLSNIMGLQGRIAERIASSLLRALTPEEEDILRNQPTGNVDAYRLYVEGRQAWNKRTQVGYRQAEESFQGAVAADPKYAKAYAGLADVYSMLDKAKEARDAARMALDLDPHLAEAHASLGLINLDLEFNVKNAEDEFKRALELDPEYPVAHYWYGRLMNMRGRIDEAIVHLKRSIELDPTVSMTYENLGVSYWFSGRYDEAISELRGAIKMNPTQPTHKLQLYWTFLAASRYRDLFDALKAYGESESLIGQYMTNMAYLRMGEKERARGFIGRNERALSTVFPSWVSFFYFILRDFDKGMAWADKAIEAHDFYMLYSYSCPLLRVLHSEPRTKALWQRLGLVD